MNHRFLGIDEELWPVPGLGFPAQGEPARESDRMIGGDTLGS